MKLQVNRGNLGMWLPLSPDPPDRARVSLSPAFRATGLTMKQKNRIRRAGATEDAGGRRAAPRLRAGRSCEDDHERGGYPRRLSEFQLCL